MNVKVSNYGEVIKIIPNIEGDGVYSIAVCFDNGEGMCYGYTNKKTFMYDYKCLMQAWKGGSFV